MELSFLLIFLVWPFFKERPNFFTMIALKTRYSLEEEVDFLYKTQYVDRCIASFNEAQPPSRFFPTWQASFFKARLPILFKCFTYIGHNIAHKKNHDLYRSNKTTYTQGFYFIVIWLPGFQSHASLPFEGGFVHTCSHTFVKKYHGRSKWSKESILSQRCPPSIIPFTCLTECCTAASLFENDFLFPPKTCCTGLHKDYTLWCHFMQGMVRLHARNVILFEKYSCTRLYCRVFYWQQTSKSMLKLVYFLYVLVLAVS